MTNISLLQVIGTALVNLSLAWLIGAFVARMWLTRGAPGWCDKGVSWLHRASFPALMICMLSSFCLLWLEAAVMSEVPLWNAGAAMWMMLTATHYGHAGLAGLAALFGLLGLHAILRKSPESRAVNFLIAALLLAFSLTRAIASHAGGQGAFSVAAWVEWTHLLFISLWVGSVMISGWVVLPMAEVVGQGALSATSNFLRLLSHYATIAIIGIVGTGLYNSYRGLGSIENLFGNRYGAILMLKVFLVTLAAALGAFNKFIGLPTVLKPDTRGMDLPAALGRIVFVLRMESVVLLGVIVAAAVLTGTAPPSI